MRNKLIFLFFLAILTMVPCVAGDTGTQAKNGALNDTIPEGFTPEMGIPMREPPEEALIVPPISQSTPYWEIWVVLAVAIIGINTFMFIRLKRKKAGFLTALILLAMLSSFPTVFAYDYGAPLETGDIGLFAYYNETTDWTLADTISGWQEYTDNGNYYDGIVRVWQDATGSDFDGVDDYVDIRCRVRADGWILAWQNQTGQEIEHYPYYAQDRYTTGAVYPEENATSMARAMERIYASAGKTFCGYEEINYYDYQFPDTEQLFMFGRKCYGTSQDWKYEYFYFIVPDGVTVEQCWSTAGGRSQYDNSAYYVAMYFDGHQVAYQNPAAQFGWMSTNCTEWCDEATQHTIQLRSRHVTPYSVITGTILLWLS